MAIYLRHALEPSDVERAEPGDFGIEVRGNIARVPQDIFEVCRRNVLRTVEELLSCAWAVPSSSSLRLALGWSEDDFEIARDAAARQLKGVVPDDYLGPPPPDRFCAGAFPLRLDNLN